jgi:transposase
MCSILIGIDWAKEIHYACIMNENGAPISAFSFPHSTKGFSELERQIAKLDTPSSDCLVALETAHTLLIDFLLSRGYQVYVIPPSVVSASRGRHRASRAHNDPSDAFLIADLLRTDRHRFAPWKPDGQLVQKMKAKLGLIDSLTKTITAYSNRLQAVLLRYFPQPLELFSDVKTQTSLLFLIAHPTPQAAQALSYSDFAAFCRSHHYTHPELLPDVHAPLSLPAPQPDPIIVSAYKDETVFLAQLLLDLVRHKALEIRKTQKLFRQHPDHPIFDSLPGAGNLLAPKLLVMFGDHRDRFPTPALIQALAGTCPVTIESGGKRRVRFRKACNRAYRHTAQQFAICSVPEAEWATAYFSRCRSHGHSKNRAYRCLANRWLKIIWTLWQRRELYNEQYHLQQIQRHRKR